MNKNKKLIKPIEGVRVLYGKEVRQRDELEAKFQKIFQGRGFSKVILPTIDRLSVFSEEIAGSSPWPQWDERSLIKVSVEDYFRGYSEVKKIVTAVLVPEGTLPLCRWLAYLHTYEGVEFKKLPKKFFYFLDCYRNELVNLLNGHKQRKFTQVGLEYFSVDTPANNYKVLEALGECLGIVANKPSDVVLRLSDVRFFSMAVQQANINVASVIRLKDFLDSIAKNRAMGRMKEVETQRRAFLSVVDKLGVSGSSRRLLLALSADNLEPEVFREYKREVFSSLLKLRDMLKERGWRAVIDPAIVRSQEYYTGVVFQADLFVGKKVFVEIAGGGRYDELVSRLADCPDYSFPAVGFAFSLERLMNVIGI